MYRRGFVPLLVSLIVATSVLAGAARSSRQSATPIRLSPDSATDPIIRRCLADSLGVIPRFTDDEPYLAVDPANGDHLVAIWQTRSGAGSVVQWTRSTDGGARWSAPRAVPVNACAGGPIAGARRASDPWVSIGPRGSIHLSAIAFTPDTGDGADLVNALVTVASSDGGRTWQPPVVAALARPGATSHDNLAVTADPTRAGTLYATTTLAETPDARTYFGRLGFTRSTDGGRSWAPVRGITPSVNRERVGAPQIVVDPRSGRLLAIYHARVGGVARLGVRWSDDQGDSWSDEAVAAPHVRGERVSHPVTGADFALADDILSAVVSPRDGHLVIAYTDAHESGGRRTALSVVWSADGRRWSSPLVVSDSVDGSAWLPAVALRGSDAVITYYTARFGTASTDPVHMRVRWRRLVRAGSRYGAREGGILDEGPLAWPGDYQSLVATRQGFIAAFGRDHDIFAQRFAP
jgi:hypothetical protein